MDENFPFFNDDIEDDDIDNENTAELPKGIPAFMITPKGLYKLAGKSDKKPKINIIGTILEEQYYISLINMVELDDDNLSLLLECGKLNNGDKSIYDAYDYLKRTHYINYLLAKKFGRSIWDNQGIKLHLQIVDSGPIKYSKILIMVETSDIPQWISDSGMVDYHQYEHTDIITDIPNMPIMENVIRAKSYRYPWLFYSINLGFNSASNLTFETIRESKFYDNILRRYIDDAIRTFFPAYDRIPNLQEIDEALIRAHFRVKCDGKLIRIDLFCAPAMCYTTDFHSLYNYVYAPGDLSMVSRIPVEREDESDCDVSMDNLCSFIEYTFSSIASQVYVLPGAYCGDVSYIGSEYATYRYPIVLCLFNRPYMGSLEDNHSIINSFKEYKSNHSFIHRYWKAIDGLIKYNAFKSSNEKSSYLYGFIEIDRSSGSMSVEDMYSTIKDELYSIFGITEEIIHNDHFSARCVYLDEKIFRVLLLMMTVTTSMDGEVVLPKGNPPQDNDIKKKKFKLFGGV